MSFKCEDCGTTFSATDCLCEDWNDPKRALGCPGCGTFYVEVPDKDKLKPWIEGLFSGEANEYGREITSTGSISSGSIFPPELIR